MIIQTTNHHCVRLTKKIVEGIKARRSDAPATGLFIAQELRKMGLTFDRIEELAFHYSMDPKNGDLFPAILSGSATVQLIESVQRG